MRPQLFGALVSMAVLAACGGGSEPRVKAASPATAVAVQASAVTTETWPDVYEASGTVRARTSAVISSRMMGYVERVSFQVGERVRQGQVLVTLDTRELDANLRRAQAARTEIESGMDEAENAIAAAQANLDLATATFHRMEELAAKRSVSRQEYDEAEARFKAARASHEMARARRVQLDSRLAQAGQEIRAAAVAREYATITAPFDGLVTARPVEPGSLASPGTPLATIERDDGTAWRSRWRSRNCR